MEPEGSMPHSPGISNIPIRSRINPIPRIDTYFLKVYVERMEKDRSAFKLWTSYNILKNLNQ